MHRQTLTDLALARRSGPATDGRHFFSVYHCAILFATILITTWLIGPSALVECKAATQAGTAEVCSVIDIRLIAFAFCFGMLGSALTASRYVVYAVRYRTYDRHRVLWQLLTPVHGGVLAVIGVYVAVGGLLALARNPSVGQQYGYFIGGFSFLVGFSSELFVKRLISATEALFGETKNIESLGGRGSAGSVATGGHRVDADMGARS